VGGFKRALSPLGWPPAIVWTVFATATMLLPNRYALLPGWAAPIVATTLTSLVAFTWAAHYIPKLRPLERPSAFTLTALLTVGAGYYFAMIIGRIAFGGSTLKGGPLLESAILMWILTALTFSLWYWLLDDGRDFFFPQFESENFPGWSPNYIDYLVLAFTTSTAFSPTDVLPASRRMKLVMLVQASLALAIIAIAAARAVNVLG
jgi:Protein of unknown function (DUF1345)